jgi:CubicO group peptidase (beta-lactamase class C family)
MVVLEDLARWISFQLRAYRDPAPGSPVLATASLREMHKPRYLADDQWTQAWGMSWCGSRQDNVTWIGHSGGLPGFTTTVCFDPVEQVGAIALVNGTSGTAALGLDLASIARRVIRDQPRVIMAPALMPGQYGPLLGLYVRPELGGGVLRLEWRDGKLAFVTPETAGWRLNLAPTGASNHFVVEPESSLAGENVIFQCRPDDRVTSVFLMDTTWVRLDRVAASGPAAVSP